MKDTLLTLTKKWIETKSVPAFDFSSRSISSYDTGNVVLLGMRRLGKTEYLKYRYQTFFNLAENISDEVATQGEDQGTPTSSETQHIDKVLFIDFDSPQFSNVIFEQKTSEEFLKLTNAIIDLINEKDIKLVLIDEIQARVEWSKWLKGMVDQHPDVTFIATGSDAVKLKQSGELGGTRFKTIYES